MRISPRMRKVSLLMGIGVDGLVQRDGSEQAAPTLRHRAVFMVAWRNFEKSPWVLPSWRVTVAKSMNTTEPVNTFAITHIFKPFQRMDLHRNRESPAVLRRKIDIIDIIGSTSARTRCNATVSSCQNEPAPEFTMRLRFSPHRPMLRSRLLLERLEDRVTPAPLPSLQTRFRPGEPL